MRVPHVTERIKEAPVQALRGVLAGIGQVLLFTDKLRNKTAASAPDETTVPANGSAETATDAQAEAGAGAEAQTGAEGAAVPVVVDESEAVAEATAAASAKAAAVAEADAKADAQATPAPAEAAPAEAAPADTPAHATAAKARRPRKARDPDKTNNVRIIAEDDATPEPAEGNAPAEAKAAAEAEAETPATAEAPEAADLPVPTYDDLSVASIRARLRNLTAAQVATLADYEKAHAARPEVITMFERRIAKLEAEG
jgi:hypothetical protein